MALIESQQGFTPIELFQIKWGENYTGRNVDINGLNIDYLSFNIDRPEEVKETLDILKSVRSDLKYAVELTRNPESSEVFAYLINQTGYMIEITCQLKDSTEGK